ncbi:hypothetical protein PM004_08350 [Clostridium paraputrificum]|uniref:hypothetical protein n=1 Tax=Clostridium TaxID=1485 RepID=UPI00232DD59A|nr:MULTISPECIES: hypothetical protein [Clostridium]MDB2089347.1 hypothetical protein [Clostridium paraputrificum]MDB2097706.1 hypothetical protein [Clostridium paraputrificum]MDU1180046.1 hypothetical protein [Clostridium sp.]MDU1228101.1 hypothetical protein [Clostridium sp.]MDU7654041.1 hypothetical protein [Clostridium sp.]
MENKSFSDMFYESFKDIIDCFNKVIVDNNKFTFEVQGDVSDSSIGYAVFSNKENRMAIAITNYDIRSPFDIYKICNEFAFENGFTNELEYEELRDRLNSIKVRKVF